MRTSALIVVVTFGLFLGGCHRDRRDDRPKQHEPIAKKIGEAAYYASQGAKKAAVAAGKELSHAGKEANQGWKEAAAKHKAKESTR